MKLQKRVKTLEEVVPVTQRRHLSYKSLSQTQTSKQRKPRNNLPTWLKSRRLRFLLLHHHLLSRSAAHPLVISLSSISFIALSSSSSSKFANGSLSF